MSDERRKVFGKSGKCLHCLVWDAIMANSDKDPTTGQLMYDGQLIVGNLVDVMAEVIASVPDRNSRRQMIALADNRLREQVRHNLETGNVCEAKEVRLQ